MTDDVRRTAKRLMALVAILSAVVANAVAPIASEYVSIDCPAGDMTLSLKTDGTYRLELKHWSEKEQRHTSTESFSGKWKLRSKTLQLFGPGTITYERKQTQMRIGGHSGSIDSLAWRGSSKTTFADRFTLVERRASDELFYKAVHDQEKKK